MCKLSESEILYILKNTIDNSITKYEIYWDKSDKICARTVH